MPFCFFSVCAAELADEDIKTKVEEAWNRKTTHTFPLGDWFVYNPMAASLGMESSVKGRILSDGMVKTAKSLEQIGLLKIELTAAAPKSASEMASHIGGRIRISLTENGKKFQLESGEKAGLYFVFNKPKYRINKILKVAHVTTATEEYRVASLLYEAEAPMELLLADSALGEVNKSRNRKARVLFVHDEFSDRWNIKTADTADEQAEFTTEKVNEIIKQNPLNPR